MNKKQVIYTFVHRFLLNNLFFSKSDKHSRTKTTILPARASRRVDLPQPEGPIMAKTSLAMHNQSHPQVLICYHFFRLKPSPTNLSMSGKYYPASPGIVLLTALTPPSPAGTGSKSMVSSSKDAERGVFGFWFCP